MKNLKIIKIPALLICMALILCSCTNFDKTLPKDALRITVRPYDSAEYQMYYTDKTKVLLISQYLDNLPLEKNDKKEKYNGSVSHYIEILSENGETTYIMLAPEIYRNAKGEEYKISFEDFTPFEEILDMLGCDNEPYKQYFK